MSLNYQAVGWNRQKKIYDRLLLGGILGYLLVFLGLGFLLHPEATAETLIIRALGTAEITEVYGHWRHDTPGADQRAITGAFRCGISCGLL